VECFFHRRTRVLLNRRTGEQECFVFYRRPGVFEQENRGIEQENRRVGDTLFFYRRTGGKSTLKFNGSYAPVEFS
jgi:hypothetical protein